MRLSPTRLQLFFARISLIVLGIFVGLSIAEVFLRFTGYSYNEFYQFDPTRGYSLRPGLQGWYRKEGSTFISINSDGLRDHEHAFQKEPNVIRIALLGDSYAEAFQVDIEDAFWSVMSKRLNEHFASSGKRIEVINFGVSGYGTAQELITLRERAWKYHPDIVLLALTTSNDISDNSRLLKNASGVPYFIRRDGQLVLDDRFKNSRFASSTISPIAVVGMRLYDHLRIVQVLAEALRTVKYFAKSVKQKLLSLQISRAAESEKRVESLLHPDEIGIDNFVYWGPQNQTWTEAWKVTEDLLATMNTEVKEEGAEFFVVTLSNAPQVLPDPKMRAEFMRSLGITDLFYPDRRISFLGQRDGFRVITLAPLLQSYAEQHAVNLHGVGKDLGFGHWNATGHRVAGEVLANELSPQIAALK